ncbi:MAG: hypothetical protein ICV66_03405 [Chitinophagaceae bacterium]|nr:hypothetical protein [Chitinophagaceae bacterium]
MSYQQTTPNQNSDNGTKGEIILIDYFKELYELGFNPVPLQWDSQSKKPFRYPAHVNGIESDSQRPSWKDIQRWYNELKPVNGIACKMLPPSFMIDFDLKNTENKNLFKKWFNAVDKTQPDIKRKICIETTRNNGYHVYGKFIHAPHHKQTLARSKTGSEIIAIYTGLLSYAAPTPGYSLTHNEMQDVEELTPDEFDFLVALSGSFNEYIESYAGYVPGESTAYPDAFKALARYFDKLCPDSLFEEFLNNLDLYSTGKTGKILGTDILYHKYLRKGSEAEYSAKVFFENKKLLIFSGSLKGLPTFHTRTDENDRSWIITPSLIVFYKNGKDWYKAAEEIKQLCEQHNINIPDKQKGKDVVQYSGFWTNNFKSTDVVLSTGALREYLVKLGFCVLDN